MKRKSAQVNSASCIFFSPAAPSEPTPRPAPALGMYSLFAKFTILCGGQQGNSCGLIVCGGGSGDGRYELGFSASLQQQNRKVGDDEWKF